MAWLKGPKSDGVIQINHPVKFNKYVQSGLFDPWSDVWYVDDENGNDSHTGRGPSDAKATIQAAVTAAGEDDIIYVRPVGALTDASDFDYYPEQVTVPYAKTNLSIIGVTKHFVNPYYGVWLRWGYGAAHTGYVLLNYAPGLCLENLGFQTGDYIRSSYGAVHMYSSTTGGAYTTHAGSVGFTVYNCFFRDGQLNVTGGYDSCTSGCTFKASGSANTGWWQTSNSLPSGGHQVRDSHFGEMFGDNQPLRYIYSVAGAHKDMLFKDLTFGIVPADNHYFWFGANNTGIAVNCHFASLDVAQGQDDAESEFYCGTANGVLAIGCYDKTGILA